MNTRATTAIIMVSMSYAAVRQRTGQHVGAAMRWFRRGLPLAVEVIMMISAARLAYTLLGDQGYFERFPGPYHWLVGHGLPFEEEWFWGAIAASAAAMKATGIGMCIGYRRDTAMLDFGYGMRLLGWLASSLVWGAFTMSLTMWEPGSFVSIAASCALALALWGLCMGPTMPDDR